MPAKKSPGRPRKVGRPAKKSSKAKSPGRPRKVGRPAKKSSKRTSRGKSPGRPRKVGRPAKKSPTKKSPGRPRKVGRPAKRRTRRGFPQKEDYIERAKECYMEKASRLDGNMVDAQHMAVFENSTNFTEIKEGLRSLRRYNEGNGVLNGLLERAIRSCINPIEEEYEREFYSASDEQMGF